MHISDLHLTHFRNYTELHIQPCNGINCLTGPNGSGKTNILDALHYLAFTRGFRSNQDKQAVQEGATFFLNEGTVDREGGTRKVQCNFVKNKGKKILIGTSPLTKMSDHIGAIPLVSVLPDDTGLIDGPSAGRRKFMDMLISQYDHSFLNHLIHYEKILSQRNALLRQFGEQGYFDSDQLEVWNEQLVPHAIQIVEGRQHFLVDFEPLFLDYFKKIVSQDEVPKITYRSQVSDNTREGWLALLAANEQRDRANLYSGAGIHRDDLIFKINEKSVRNFGSQGQQKTFVIALRLAQYQLLERQTGIAPILLLDDIFDKLDEHRLGSIAKLLDNEVAGQVFITDTSLERLQTLFASITDSEVAYFQVHSGVVTRSADQDQKSPE